MTRLFLFLLILFSGVVHADYSALVRYTFNNITYQSDVAGSCKAYNINSTGVFRPGSTSGYFDCELRIDQQAPYWSFNKVWENYTCPNGGTLTGTVCVKTCTPPQEQLPNGQCVDPCPLGYDRGPDGQCLKNCIGKAGQPTTNGKYSFSGAVDQWAVSGCKVRCKVRVLYAGMGSGSECTYTGASADPNQPEATAQNLDPPPDKTPPDCLGKGQGYITSSTGKTTCVPSGNAPEGQNPTKKESDSVKESGTAGTDGKPDPGAGDYKKEETTTSSSGGKSTTTTKTTTNSTEDGNGLKVCPQGYTLDGDLCTKTSSTTEDTGDFCQKNPTHPTCKGDKDTDECVDNPERVGCAELREAPPEDGLGGQTIGTSSISVIGVSGSAGCPSGGTMPKGLGSYDFTPMCDFASAMQPIVLAFAFLSAGLIVIGAFRE